MNTEQQNKKGELGNDPKHFGAELGIIAILHIWGQNLTD